MSFHPALLVDLVVNYMNKGVWSSLKKGLVHNQIPVNVKWQSAKLKVCHQSRCDF